MTEQQLYFNSEELLIPNQKFGDLMVKKYLGTNPTLLKLNKPRGYIGTAEMKLEGENSVWYFYAEDGETYRIPEPEDGIDEVLELDFKRVVKKENLPDPEPEDLTI